MKCSVVALIVIGLVTALSAAVLVSRLASPPREAALEQDRNVPVVECTKDLERGMVVLREDVQTRSVPLASAPKNGCQDPSQVIGQVLVLPMTKGQAFTETCFAVEGQGLQVAGRLPDGMRAVSVDVSDSSGLHGLLYPGSVVDVLVSLKSGSRRGSISKTLLEGIQVLAVNEQTLYSHKESEGGDEKAGSRSRNMVVTLLVNMTQAQHIQLAERHGTLSLALRNPRDVAKSTHEPTHLGALVGQESKDEQVSNGAETMKTSVVEVPVEATVSTVPERPRWQVTVIQGTKRKEVNFDVPKEKDK